MRTAKMSWYSAMRKTGDRFEILDPRLNEDETATVQNEVFQMLGWNG